MRVVFRADASVEIGTGHVMRCLALAGALAARGHECRFICRDLPGQLGPRIRGAGFALALLPAPPPGFRPASGQPAHAAWAGVPWERDAAETLAAAGDAEVLVLDHYAFAADWEAAARPEGARLVVLDDLADRPHLADLLVDQNFGRRPADYDGLMPPQAERLIGPRHALLRPEFSARRASALQGRADRGHGLRRVLVTMGGVDLPNATGKVLAALAGRSGLRVTVVMGANAPALPAVQAQAAALPIPAEVLVNVADMARLMAEADLAIGAAGGTAWERCALGLPSLMAVLADNQAEAARALDAAGVAISLGRPEAPEFEARLTAALERLADPATLAAMAERAAAVTDGRGADRVAGAIEHPLALRPASMEDAERIWHWRRAAPAESFRAGPTPSLPEHLVWFERALTDPRRRLYVAGTPTQAHLRLDLTTQDTAAISVLLAPEARGKGAAPRLLGLLALAARAEGITTLQAEVHPANAASLALFRAAGFAETGLRDGFQTFALTL